LRIGDSDLDVLSWAMDEILRHAGAPVAYDGNLGLGSAGGDFEAQPQGVRAAAGDVLFVDLYPMRHGYAGDSTRSFVMGHPPAWAVAAHARLVRALEAAEAALLPGTAAGEVDRVCREAAASDGGEAIPHHVGHGLGIFGQEAPYLVPGNPDLLRTGDVVAVEPGVYRPGEGGLRLEDVFVVTESGARRLTGAPRELRVCG
jgi:Xaa-Pro aminopeptidase